MDTQSNSAIPGVIAGILLFAGLLLFKRFFGMLPQLFYPLTLVLVVVFVVLIGTLRLFPSHRNKLLIGLVISGCGVVVFGLLAFAVAGLSCC